MKFTRIILASLFLMSTQQYVYADGGSGSNASYTCRGSAACPLGQDGNVSFSMVMQAWDSHKCPAAQSSFKNNVAAGWANADLQYRLKKDYAWGTTTVSRNCVNTGPTYQSTQKETQTLICPADQPSGTWTQKRTYELWSDGSHKNVSGWTDVSKTCAAIPTQTVETKEGVEEVSCDSYYGAVQGSYTGSVYKYGEHVSIFADGQTTTIFNVKSIDVTSCTEEIQGLSTEYMNGDCPAGQTGLIQYYRYKAVNGKSEAVYPYGSDWVTLNNTCSAMDVDKAKDSQVQDEKASLLGNIYFTSTDIIKNDALTSYLNTIADKGWSATDKHKLTINIDDLSSGKYNATKISNAIAKFQSVVGVNNADVNLVLPRAMERLMGDGGVTTARTSSKLITLKSIELVGNDAVVKYLDISSGNSNSMPVEKQFKIPVLTSAVSLQGVSAN
jgi:hypothetical protein